MNRYLQKTRWVRALLATTILTCFSGSAGRAQEANDPTGNSTLLDTIIVKPHDFLTASDGVSDSDTGTTILTPVIIKNKTDGVGDANTMLRNLPNVQYQNDSDNDAGVDGQDMINLRPLEVSISGAKVYENNFRLNGVGVNNVTGSEDPFAGSLGSYEQTPNINQVFGLHSQTVFVPAEFISEATIIDSNVPARFGQFQGGVVDYKLSKPSQDKASGFISYGFESDETTTFNLGTADGLNPQGNPHPEFFKYKTAAQVNAPVTENWAIRAQYSHAGASTSKIKDYRYYSDIANETSSNDFYRLASKHDTDLGIFTLEGSFTDYQQEWDGYYYRDTQILTQNKGLTSQLSWESDLDSFVYAPLGIENVKVDSKLFYNRSRTTNDGGENETIYRTVWARSSVSNTNPASWFYSTDPSVTSWCRAPLASGLTGTAQLCREGGYGNKEQGQDEAGFKSDLEGDLLLGTFSAGLEYRKIDAYRKADEYTVYSSNYTLLDSPIVSSFVCAAGDPACSYEQYARIKTVTPAYHNRVSLNSLDLYAEVDQTWNWLNVRAGVHVSHEDFFGNLNFAPRLTATITPAPDFSIIGGFNRYYNADSVYYAIRDGQPRARAYNRSHNSSGVISDWVGTGRQTYYSFAGLDLSTPFTDEFTAGIKWVDPWAGGTLKIRYMYRQGKDQYLAAAGSSTTAASLTNDGESQYHSASLEYGKSWAIQNGNLETATLSGSITWSKRKTTANGYFDDETDTRIWYNASSYALGEFGMVTGNMDIPIRTSLDLNTTWFENRFEVGLSGNFNLAYDGVRSTDNACTPSTGASATCQLPAGSEGLGVTHEIFEDFRYKPRVTVDLNTKYHAIQNQYGALDLEMKVQNIFNDTGNAAATQTSPWLKGRSIWLGAKATF